MGSHQLIYSPGKAHGLTDSGLEESTGHLDSPSDATFARAIALDLASRAGFPLTIGLL
jgi:hypothetical protein